MWSWMTAGHLNMAGIPDWIDVGDGIRLSQDSLGLSIRTILAQIETFIMNCPPNCFYLFCVYERTSGDASEVYLYKLMLSNLLIRDEYWSLRFTVQFKEDYHRLAGTLLR